MVKRIVWWALTLACAVLILGFSLQSVASSMQLSGSLTDLVLEQDTAYQQLSQAAQVVRNDKLHDALRSCAHVAMFTALGFCASMLARTYYRKWWRIATPACMIFAVVDEGVQFLRHAGRTFQLSDIGRDWLGVGIGTAIAVGIAVLVIMKEKRKHGISGTGS